MNKISTTLFLGEKSGPQRIRYVHIESILFAIFGALVVLFSVGCCELAGEQGGREQNISSCYLLSGGSKSIFFSKFEAKEYFIHLFADQTMHKSAGFCSQIWWTFVVDKPEYSRTTVYFVVFRKIFYSLAATLSASLVLLITIRLLSPKMERCANSLFFIVNRLDFLHRKHNGEVWLYQIAMNPGASYFYMIAQSHSVFGNAIK